MTTQTETLTSYATAAELLAVIQPAEGGRELYDPATGEVVGRTPEHTVADLETAITAATAAQPDWAELGHAERSALMHRAADAVEANAEALAELLSREQGKPLNGPNARFEVSACATWLRATADFDLDPEVLVDDETTRVELHYRPLGVVGAIGPWNWPMMISTWQFAPALRMGNTVVLKPSGNTPLSVLALAQVLNTVLPANVLHVVAGRRDVGAVLAKHSGIAKVMFTGSTAAGQDIIHASAATVKRLTLELGGNDAGIVLPDADPAAIAQDLFWGAFINTGQTCAALKRLYVHEDLYEDTVAALAAVAAATPMGVGLDEANLLGPLQNQAQYDIVANLVQQAKDAGARIVTGGNPDQTQPGYFYPATLVADIDHDHPLVTEEQFGPVLPIIKYTEVDQAIEMANGLDVGLGSSVWSADQDQALAVAARLEAGTTWINQHGAVDPRAPFGGAKMSGYGLEFGIEGLKQLAQPHVIHS